MPCFGIRAPAQLHPSSLFITFFCTNDCNSLSHNNSYNPAKTKLSGRGLEGNFKSLRFHFEEGRVGRKRKIFRWQSDSTIKFCCLFSTICKRNQAVWEYKGGSAPTQKEKKNLCIACSKAFI